MVELFGELGQANELAVALPQAARGAPLLSGSRSGLVTANTACDTPFA